MLSDFELQDCFGLALTRGGRWKGENNSYHEMNVYCVPGTVPSTLSLFF